MTAPSYDLDELAKKAKDQLDNDPDLIIQTDIKEGVRLLICRTGVDPDDYRVCLEKAIEFEDSDGILDEDIEQVSEDGSSLQSIYGIISYYISEGGDPESI